MKSLVRFLLVAQFCALSSLTGAFAADKALIEAAKKEGQVTWYTVQIVDQIVRPVIEAFERKYGIPVNYVRANSTEIGLRVINEAKAGRVQASVIDGVQTTVMLKREGLVLKWTPDADLPKNLFDPEGYWVACNFYINTPGFNTDLVPKGSEPKTFEDLLDPKWKGKLAWNTQPSVSAGQGFVGSVLIAMGEEKARAYLARLAMQNVTPLKVSGRQVLDLVIAGEYPIGLQIFNNHAFISANKGAPVDQDAAAPGDLCGHVGSEGCAKLERRETAGRLHRVGGGAENFRQCWRVACASCGQGPRSRHDPRWGDVQGLLPHARSARRKPARLVEAVRRILPLTAATPSPRRGRQSETPS